VAHAYNPNYSGGRDQEDHGLGQPGQRVWETPFSKIIRAKWTGGIAQVVSRVPALQAWSPEFKP
jgi:hypothetical protein